MAELNHQTSIGVVITVGTDITLNNVSDIPDLIAAPEKIEVTAVGDDTKKYTNGLKDPGDLEFTLWYDKAVYAKLKDLEGAGTQKVTIKLSDGSYVEIDGDISVGFSGFGAGDAIQFTMGIAASRVEWFEEAAPEGPKA